jgi:hypothetical protein
MISQQELANKRYEALLQQHPDVALTWARSQMFAHILLSKLESLGWNRDDQLMALQELHRSTWSQVEIFQQENL